jgi:hypothetical protein
MANVLGLAMKITADASGLQKSLTPVDRALQKLGEQASASAALFDKFLGSTTGAAAVQRQFATDIAFLTSEMRRGLRSPQEFAAEFERLQEAASATASAFAEATAISERFATAQESQATRLERLTQLYDLGALKLDAYNRASSDAIGINAQVAKAEQERAALSARAAQLQEQARTPMQRYDAEVQELFAHLNTFNLNQQQFNTLVEQATQRFVRAESAAKGYDVAVEQAGKNGNLAFNELAGTLAILPGPIGNVAGRLSGISSAAEGLNRIFSNGGGIGQFGVAIAGLVNPTTLALGGLAAFGAGAVAAGRGLVQLEGEVERLGNLADKLGASFDFIQVLEDAAGRSGGSVDQLSAGFTRFLKTVSDARAGSESAAAAFGRLGIGIDAVRGTAPEQLFRSAAEAITQIQDPAARTAAAMALFGKSGADLVPTLQKIGVSAADIERLGGGLGASQRRDVDAFGDSLDRLGTAAQGFGRQVSASFAQAGAAIADSSAEAIGSINKLIQEQNRLAEESNKWRAERGIVTFFERLGLAVNPAVKELEDARKAAEALANVKAPVLIQNDEFQAAVKLQKTFEDLKAASEDFGANQEFVAQAAGRAVDAFSKEAEAAGMSADNIKAFADGANADFGRFVEGLKKVSDESKRAAEERNRAIEQVIRADQQRADAFIQNNGLSDEADAAKNLLAITRQIDEAETAIVQARASGDAAAEKAALRRLQILDQAQAAAQDTFDFGFNANDIQQAVKGAQAELDAVIAKVGQFGDAGRKAAQDLQGGLADAGVNIDVGDIGDRFGQAGVQAGIEFQKGLAKAQQQFEGGVIVDPKGFDAAIQKQRQLFEDRIKQLEDIRNLELQIIEERASVEEDRLAALRRASQQPLQISDIRTQEGASELVRLATGREDPAIAEYRKQLDQLKKLENRLERLGAVPVEIMGG